MNGDKNLNTLFNVPFNSVSLCLSDNFFYSSFIFFLFVYLRQVSALFNSSLIAQRHKILFFPLFLSIQLRCTTIFFTTFSVIKLRQLYILAFAVCPFAFALFGTVINFTLGSFRRYLYPLIYIFSSKSLRTKKEEKC